MKTHCAPKIAKGGTSAITLMEVVLALSIAMIGFAGIITTYIQATYKAEWSGYSLAAQALAIQQLEQSRCADWDIKSVPVKNEITNVPTMTWATMDIPVSGSNVVYATNYVTITSVPITNTLNASVYLIRVDTVWPFIWRRTKTYFTNTVMDYQAPD